MFSKKLASALVLGALTMQVVPASAVFTDVDADFQLKLDTLKSLHVVTDSANGAFRPTEGLNRAEAATLVLRTSQVFDEKKSFSTALRFSDIDQNAWYIPYVKGAVTYGILKGYADGTIKLEKGVSKAELLVMLMRMDTNLRTPMKGKTLSKNFSDVTAKDWFYDAVMWSQSFKPVEGDTFEPHKALTRQEAAEIIYAYAYENEIGTKNAFGVIAYAGDTAPSGSEDGRTQSGGGASTATPVADQKMIMPPYGYDTQLTFSYSGAKLTDIPSEVALYKVVSGNTAQAGVDFASVVPTAFQSFVKDSTQMLLQSISFTDNETNGYQYYLDLVNGSYSVYEDWARKIQPVNQVYELSEEPSTTGLLALARSFLIGKGLSLDTYGSGEVDNSWRMYAMSSDTTKMTYPTYYTVNFPYLVEGKKLLSEWGYPEGAISVGIDETIHRVTNLYGSLPKTTVVSQYDAKQWDDVVAGALKGGLHMPYVPYYYNENPENTTNPELPKELHVALTNAEVVYVVARQYQDSSYMNPTEYYVPAVLFTGSFPEISGLKSDAREARVIVPLVQDALFQVTSGPIMYMKGSEDAKG